MKKQKILIPTIIVIILMFVVFWNGTFSIHSDNDTGFFIGYVCVFIWLISATLLFHFKKDIINCIPAIVLCVGTLVALIMYRNWNREGYYIDIDDVESVVYSNMEEWPTEEVAYEGEELEFIINMYNGVHCIKNWDLLGDAIGFEEFLYITLKDGTRITINPPGFVSISKKGSDSRKYKIDMRMEELLP